MVEGQNIEDLLTKRFGTDSIAKSLINNNQVSYTSMIHKKRDKKAKSYFVVRIDVEDKENNTISNKQNKGEKALQDSLENNIKWIPVSSPTQHMTFDSSLNEDEDLEESFFNKVMSKTGKIIGYDFEVNEATKKLLRKLAEYGLGKYIAVSDKRISICFEHSFKGDIISSSDSKQPTNHVLTLSIPASKTNDPAVITMRFNQQGTDFSWHMEGGRVRPVKRGVVGFFVNPKPLQTTLLKEINSNHELREAIKEKLVKKLSNLKKQYESESNGFGGYLFSVRSKKTKISYINQFLKEDYKALFMANNIQRFADTVHYGTLFKSMIMNAFNETMKEKGKPNLQLSKSREVIEALREVYLPQSTSTFSVKVNSQ